MAIRKPVEGADFEGRRRRRLGREREEGNETPFRRQNGRGEAGEFQFHFREDAAPSTRLDSRRPFVCRFHTGGGGGAGVVYMIVIGVLLVSRALLFFFPFFFLHSVVISMRVAVESLIVSIRLISFDSRVEGWNFYRDWIKIFGEGLNWPREKWNLRERNFIDVVKIVSLCE